MLRLFRLSRSLLPLSVRAGHSQPQPQVVQIQRVKFRTKRFKPYSILLRVAACYAFYQIITRALVVMVDEAELELTEEERQEIEEEEIEPMFIPFPGFTQTVESQPYRSTDPEWRAYVQVSRNQALLTSMRGGLADIVLRAVSSHPLLLPKEDREDARVSKYWLDVQYPLRPPPTFLRQGLSFGGGDGVTWTKQPVDPVAVFWTRQALWPSAITLSLWSFTRALVAQNVATVTRLFGHESQPDPSGNMQQTLEKLQQQLKKQSGKPGSVPSPLPPQDRTDEGSTTSSLTRMDERSAGSTAAPETLGKGANMDNDVPNIPSAKDTQLIRSAQVHTSGPWDKFKQSLAQKWRKTPAYPPRGSIRVSGLVELNTSRQIITIDCMGWWDPQTETYDGRTLTLALRAIRPKLQTPLRR
ncbi:hypothetical protein F5X98DRAFT_222046 [Xylaria grammica]|nr:hypothetical protein F5X98DRAFT_222046 [Xylaria grammica]